MSALATLHRIAFGFVLGVGYGLLLTAESPFAALLIAIIALSAFVVGSLIVILESIK